MTILKIRSNRFVMAAAATIAVGAAFLSPGFAKANTDGPWPEQPSCSNDTFTCTSIADQLAYECFFEESDFPIKWCDNPLEELSQDSKGFAIAEAEEPDSAARKVAIPARLTRATNSTGN